MTGPGLKLGPLNRMAEDQKDAAKELPAGFVFVDVILTTHQAYIVKKWEAAAKVKMRADAAQTKLGIDARNEVIDFQPGMRCRIVSVHHPCFSSDVGKIIVVTKVSSSTRQVWAHDDKPVKYRINRNGQCVTDYDPRCIQSLYGFEQLRLLI